MFGSPEVVDTEVVGRLPAVFRKTTSASEIFGGRQVECFLEGPSFDREGNLFVVDVPWGRIFRMAPDGAFTLVAEYDGWPSGLKISESGRVFVADLRRGILELDPGTGRLTPLVTNYRTEGLKGCNDLFLGPEGEIYFTDQGQSGWQDPTGRVFRLNASGNLDLLLGTAPSPNGIVLNLDGSGLYVAVTRANAVWRLPLVGGGTSRVGTFLNLSGGLAGPDGLALDEGGGLYVAHAGLGTVWGFTEIGEPRYRIRSCEGLMTTNIAFGGPDMRELFIVESHSGSILRARLAVAGRPLGPQVAGDGSNKHDREA